MPTTRSTARRAKVPTYSDILGREWTVDKLDSLLARPDVQAIVDVGYQNSVTSRGFFRSSACYDWCQGRYEREAPAALLLLLVVRRHDLEARP